jgi:hypothetical protein
MTFVETLFSSIPKWERFVIGRCTAATCLTIGVMRRTSDPLNRGRFVIGSCSKAILLGTGTSRSDPTTVLPPKMLLQIVEYSNSIAVDSRFYLRHAFSEPWPDIFIISCSSTLSWYNTVQQRVIRRVWLVRRVVMAISLTTGN